MRSIVFDVVGTLITPEPSAAAIYHRVGTRHGCRLDADEVARRFGVAFRSAGRGATPDDPHRTDEAAERDFWRAVVAAVFDDLPAKAADASFAELFAAFADPRAWRVYDDVGPTLRSLAAAGTRLAVASNFDRRLHGVLDGLPELSPLSRRFVSSEIGRRKPDPRFFAAVCDGLDLRPDEVLYVGDEPQTDAAAASAAGLRSLLLRRGGPAGPGVIASLAELPRMLRPATERGTPSQER